MLKFISSSSSSFSSSISKLNTSHTKKSFQIFFSIRNQSNTSTNNNNKQKLIDFNDTKITFQSKSFSELLRGYFVFQICTIPFLVSNSEKLIKTSYNLLGKTLTDFSLKLSFFSHFCAGRNTEEIGIVIKEFEKNGIGSILDYAAEADIEEEEGSGGGGGSDKKGIKHETSDEQKKVQVRTYDYKNEALCDQRTKVFEDCLISAHKVKGNRSNAFVAIKCTALTDPQLLEKMSITVIELRNLFHKFDVDGSGYITLDEFKTQYESIFSNSDSLNDVFNQLDTNKDGKVDYIAWSNTITIEDLKNLTKHCKVQGPLFKATFTDEEREMLLKMRGRVNYLAELASKKDVQMMIDAEHTYFQPAIDNIAYTLMHKYNKEKAVIFSTYQMYLNDSMGRLVTDLNRAKIGNYFFAAKIVRGAYLELEKKRALDLKYPNPIQPNKAETDKNYNNAINEILKRISEGSKIELMIASHNQNSIEKTVELMNQYQISPQNGPIHFAQLMGMADYLTYGLGRNGYKAYKYVPYGEIKEVMPYLTRRAQENSGMMGGAHNEINMLTKEIKRRLGF